MIVSRVNYYAWARMLAAELYDVTRDFDNAAIAYEEAIDHAQTHGFCLAEALSCELAAKSYYRRGLKRVACAFYQEAISGYHRLGAVGKANHLRDGFGRNLRRLQRTTLVDQGCQTDTILRELLQASIHEESRAAIGPQGHVSGPPTRDYARRTESFTSDSDDNRPIGLDSNNLHIVLDALDLNSIIKSSQLIASEVKMDDLLKRMCEIVLDSAGSQADLAAIIVKDEEADQFVVSAMGGPDVGAQSLKSGVKIEAKENEISKPVIFYVLRTKKPLFLRNLVLDERFSNPNKAWLEKNPASKSIIALPIQHESLLGVLYVEGTVDTLTDRNLLVLEYLTSQIGISIKNALLFQRIGKISIANHALIESQKEAITKAKNSEAKAKKATEEAIRMMKLKEDASRAKSEFLANVSHELRTPLSGVIGLTELLNETPMTAAQQNLSDSIRLCADTLLTVINDILDFSKIEAGKMKLSIGEFNVADCIRDVIRALTMANKGKKALMPGLSIAMVNNAVAKQNLVNVIEQIDLPLDRLVYGDKSRLHQVLMNILSNSFKFCNEGSITVRAKVDGETEDDLQILVTVADTGIGIDDYTIRLLFTPFSQADTSTARRYGGTGLGLSICKHLVEMMGGKIWLESTVGKGTTVFFTVKFKKVRTTGPIAWMDSCVSCELMLIFMNRLD
jgi:signal transduction histidine kinase